MNYAQAKGYSPGISVCADILYGSFSDKLKHFKKGEEVAHRIAVLYMEISPKKTADLARSIKLEKAAAGQVLHLKLPEGGTAEFEL